MHVRATADSNWRWPPWQEDPTLAVATVYRPIGYERFLGDLEPEDAALPLGRALLDRPDRVAELVAPFVIGVFEPEAGRVTLVTDALGIGPLFQLRFHGGWVWSNRPAATCLFAGVPAVADRAGWRTFAATGWFMGDSTPFEQVYAVPAGTQVGYQSRGRPGRVERRTETLAAFASTQQSDALATERVAEVAEALRSCALSLPRMRTGEIQVALSGGRDSRVVAAAFLSAGVDMHLYTTGTESGEAAIAEQLVAALPNRVEHRVNRPDPKAETEALRVDPTTLERAMGWHRWREGLKVATYLPWAPPDRFQHAERIGVGGAGGEIARGYYYPANFAEIDSLPAGERFEVLCSSLEKKIARKEGVSRQARRDTAWQVRRTLLAAAMAGLEGAATLDYFFAAEDLRCWSSLADWGNSVAPLLVPEFLRAAFGLTPEQRRADALHEAVTAYLIPAWADMPYYKRTLNETAPELQPRLGLAPDHEAINAIVANPDTWGDGHEVAVVQREWARVRTGRARTGSEALLQRVIWRATFSEYLAELNGGASPSFAQPATTPEPTNPSRASRVLRLRRFTARALRHAAKLVD